MQLCWPVIWLNKIRITFIEETEWKITMVDKREANGRIPLKHIHQHHLAEKAL